MLGSAERIEDAPGRPRKERDGGAVEEGWMG